LFSVLSFRFSSSFFFFFAFPFVFSYAQWLVFNAGFRFVVFVCCVVSRSDTRPKFFDKEQVLEPNSKKPLDVVFKMKIQCVASGRGKLLLGDQEGYVNVLDREFALDGFRGHTSSIMALVQINARNLLVTVGVDEEQPVPTIKIWNMEREDKGGSRLVRAIRVPSAEKSAVTALACLDDLSQLAVGLADGSVVLFGGDLVRDNNAKSRVCVEKSASPVTGLGFLQQGKGSVLFVATKTRVLCVKTAGKDLGVQVLDEFGCETGCSTMTDAGEFAMGRDEAVYFYTPEGRGACRPFEGQKVQFCCCFWFGLSQSIPTVCSVLVSFVSADCV
jgi:vacuolar protein sorting-associated protein 11